MRTREVIKQIAKAAKAAEVEWELDRHGANHDVYKLDGLTIPIPRHNELGNRAAEMIWKECEPKFGEGWWK